MLAYYHIDLNIITTVCLNNFLAHLAKGKVSFCHHLASASSFGGKDFFKSANQKQELPVVAMLVNGSGQNVQSVERTFHRC
jgi:hypothetical protein